MKDIKLSKSRKSSITYNSRISEGKSKELASEGETRTASIGSKSIEDASGKDEKAKVSLEAKATKSRKSGDVKGLGGDGEQKRKSTEIKARKSGDANTQAEKARRKSVVKDIEEKEKSGRSSGGGTNLKITKKLETGKHTTKTEETEKKKEKLRARKSISVNSLINSNSTNYTVPNKLTQNPPYPSSTALFQPSSVSSTLPFLDAAKYVTSLPSRVKVDEEEYKEEIEPNTNAEVEIQEGESEGKEEKQRSGKRKSDEVLVSEKPKRTRSSVMACPVPAKVLPPPPPPSNPFPFHSSPLFLFLFLFFSLHFTSYHFNSSCV
jgi:hypothetical protein